MGILMKLKTIHFFGILSIFLFIISVGIALTINMFPLYWFDIDYLGIAEYVGVPKEILVENYTALMRYLNLPWVTTLNMPDFPSSANGLLHFHEVKRLFLLDYAVLIGSGIGSFFFIRYLKIKKLIWILIRPFQIALVAPVVVLFFVAVSFDRLFVLFHEVFFNNDAWIFNPATDPIIEALPQEFFMHCFILAFVLIEVQFLLGYLLTRRELKK